MRIDLQVPAHLRQEVTTDFFLPILKGGEFPAEVQTTMAALPFVGHELTGDILEPRQLLHTPLEPPFTVLYSRTYLSEGRAEKTSEARVLIVSNTRRSLTKCKRSAVAGSPTPAARPALRCSQYGTEGGPDAPFAIGLEFIHSMFSSDADLTQ